MYMFFMSGWKLLTMTVCSPLHPHKVNHKNDLPLVFNVSLTLLSGILKNNTHPSQSVHPAVIWQKIQKYPLPYHQTTQQLHSPDQTHLKYPSPKNEFAFLFCVCWVSFKSLNVPKNKGIEDSSMKASDNATELMIFEHCLHWDGYKVFKHQVFNFNKC